MKTADRKHVDRSGFEKLILQFDIERIPSANNQGGCQRAGIRPQTRIQRLFATTRETVSDRQQRPSGAVQYLNLCSRTHQEASVLMPITVGQRPVADTRVGGHPEFI
jgi:hypothetical protein